MRAGDTPARAAKAGLFVIPPETARRRSNIRRQLNTGSAYLCCARKLLCRTRRYIDFNQRARPCQCVYYRKRAGTLCSIRISRSTTFAGFKEAANVGDVSYDLVDVVDSRSMLCGSRLILSQAYRHCAPSRLGGNPWALFSSSAPMPPR